MFLAPKKPEQRHLRIDPMPKHHPKRLIFMRHGQTEWNTTARLNSTTDLSLSEQGRTDILALKPVLRPVPIDRILASPLKRAVETAQLVSGTPEIRTDPRLTEINFGPFEGRSPHDLTQGALAEAFARWRREDDPIIPDGAEDFEHAARRAESIFTELQALDGATLVVSHGVFLRVLLCACVLGMPPRRYRRLRLDNGCFAVVTHEGELLRLTRLNSPTI